MDIGVHVLTPSLIAKRWISRWAVLGMMLGGALPDTVSAIEHVAFWFGWVDHLWVWRNLFHDPVWVLGNVVPWLAIPLGLGILTVVVIVPTLYLVAGFIGGLGIHLLLDHFIHAPGGGWYGWAPYVDYPILFATLAYIIIKKDWPWKWLKEKP